MKNSMYPSIRVKKAKKESEMRPGRCKEHPDNNQQTGVCPSCLREKLSRLDPIQSNQKPFYPYNSSLAFDYPAEENSSNHASRPVYHSRRHRRSASEVMYLESASEKGFDYELKKSRSIALASTNEVTESYARKKGGLYGFWSKLLKLTRKGTKNVLRHSTTTREGRGR